MCDVPYVSNQAVYIIVLYTQGYITICSLSFILSQVYPITSFTYRVDISCYTEVIISHSLCIMSHTKYITCITHFTYRAASLNKIYTYKGVETW